MHPRDTDYHLAKNPREYRRCRTLLSKEGISQTLSYPTVFAERGGEVIGVLGTIPNNDMIVAGPLVIRTEGNTAILALRLIEAYELVLKSSGVKFYNFGIETTQETWISAAVRAGAVKRTEVDGTVWFQKDVNG